MTFADYKLTVLNHLNSMNAVHMNSTPETWPALRDAHLQKIGMVEELSHIEY